MSLTPGYGETPVSDEDLDSLHQHVRNSLGEPVSKAAVYDLEQVVQADVTEDLVTAVLDGGLTYDELLRDHFLRSLHRRLYGEIWVWGGVFRRRELNIGVEPSQIAVQLRSALDAIRYRWEHTDDWSPRQLGIAVHAETVRIHPFTDGNGRTTRLLADLVFVAVQDGDVLEQYDWDVDKLRYVTLLREYDGHRDARDLAAFIAVQPFGE
jgi:fido (protein-threonine AMPylation protein)